jgi:ParB-like chromosome segregation protein Spo0J
LDQPGEGSSEATDAVREIPLHAIDDTDRTYQLQSDELQGSLVHSLAREGLRQPVVLMSAGTTHRILDGFRRVEGARILGWATIAARVYPPMFEREARRVAFASNVIHDGLTVLEKARAIRLARRQGFSKAEVVSMFGMSQRQIERYLALPDGILEYVDGRIVTMAHARILARYLGSLPSERLPELIAELRDAQVSAQVLPRWLEARGLLPVVPIPRPRAVGSISPEKVRFYDMVVSPASPDETRQSTLDFLRRAIRHIEEFDQVGRAAEGRSD